MTANPYQKWQCPPSKEYVVLERIAVALEGINEKLELLDPAKVAQRSAQQASAKWSDAHWDFTKRIEAEMKARFSKQIYKQPKRSTAVWRAACRLSDRIFTKDMDSAPPFDVNAFNWRDFAAKTNLSAVNRQRFLDILDEHDAQNPDMINKVFVAPAGGG